jgi:hypothetical protein
MEPKDRERLAIIEERTRCLPRVADAIERHEKKITRLEADKWWLFTLIGAGWAAVIALFIDHKI